MTNAEKFKNVDSRERGFLLFCNKHNEDGSCVKCPLNNKAKKRLGCAHAWLDLEAEEEKAMPCPFCGDDCEVVGVRLLYVECLSCNYESMVYDSKDEAIAAHNRICKAVAAYKESEVK